MRMAVPFLAVALLVTAAVRRVGADIPPLNGSGEGSRRPQPNEIHETIPDQQPQSVAPKQWPLTIKVVSGVKDTRLQIPTPAIDALYAKKDSPPSSDQNHVFGGIPRFHTIVAGLALALALACAGLWVARSRRRLVVGSLGLMMAIFTVIGIGCPATDQNTVVNDSPAPLGENAHGGLSGDASITVTKNDDTVKLLIDGEMLKKLIDKDVPKQAGEGQ
jgi:hypothetical protein